MSSKAYLDMERIIDNGVDGNIYSVVENDGAPTVIIMRGLPGSGKSSIAQTWAFGQEGETGRAVISRDDLRIAFFGEEGALSSEKEMTISEAVEQAISSALARGIDVVVDATHLKRAHMMGVAKVAYTSGASIAVVNVSVPAETCINNIAVRVSFGGRHVNSDVITDMNTRFSGWNEKKNNLTEKDLQDAKPNFAPYRHNSVIDKPTVLFDIDGTLAKMVEGGRSPYDWHRVMEDAPNTPVINQLKINRAAGNEIVIFSGRSDECRKDTEAWLSRHGIEYEALFMRKAGDNRKDDIVKREMLEIVEKNYGPVVGIFDDRNQVVDMFRSVGLTVFQVDYGDF